MRPDRMVSLPVDPQHDHGGVHAPLALRTALFALQFGMRRQQRPSQAFRCKGRRIGAKRSLDTVDDAS